MAGTLQQLPQIGCKCYSLQDSCTSLLMDSRRRSHRQPNLHKSTTLPSALLVLLPSTLRIGNQI